MSCPTLNIGCGPDRTGSVRVDLSTWSAFNEEPSAANVVADAENLPFRDTVFNDVLCANVLEHLDNPKQAIAEARRVGGRCRFIYPHDRWGLIVEVLSTVSHFFTKRKPLETCRFIRKWLRWKERHLDHKWRITMPGQQPIFSLVGPFKVHTHFLQVQGRMWLGKPLFTIAASILKKGKPVLDFYAQVPGSLAQSFGKTVDDWVKSQ
jgi:SAM-dependent methyltransferase